MRLRIALDGRDREVVVSGDPPDVRVAVAGREVPVRVEVHEASATAVVGDRTITLEFRGGVRIDGRPRRAEVTWLAEEDVAEGLDATVDVRPPMPGRIVRVLAAAGDRVGRGAPLVVLEAMKMQNEVPAPVAGTVREVRVKEGDVVAAGAVLVRISRGPA